jgi:hypothetical protein
MIPVTTMKNSDSSQLTLQSIPRPTNLILIRSPRRKKRRLSMMNSRKPQIGLRRIPSTSSKLQEQRTRGGKEGSGVKVGKSSQKTSKKEELEESDPETEVGEEMSSKIGECVTSAERMTGMPRSLSPTTDSSTCSTPDSTTT